MAEKLKYRTAYNALPIIGQDLSRETEDIYEEVPAFMVNPETGELLNETSQPKLIYKGKINVHEKIQSFKNDTDIYAILERFAQTGDTTLINVKQCNYGDISEIPKNLNEISQFLAERFKVLDNINPELAKMIVDNATAEEIEKKANEIYTQRLEEYKTKTGKDGIENA